MHIGIISDSESLIPLSHTLASFGMQVYLYFSPSNDDFVNQYIRTFAAQYRISVSEERNHQTDLYDWLNATQPELCFIIGYRYLIQTKRVPPSTRMFNIHFGPLPAYKGPSPVFWQIRNGEKNLGISIHLLNDQWDSGDLVWQKAIPNLPHYNCKIATQELSRAFVEGVISLVQQILTGQPIPALKRINATESYQKRPSLDDVLIHWQTMNALQICQLIQACNPWNKGAITSFKQQEVKLMDANILNESTDGTHQAGTILACQNELRIQCRDQKQIVVSMLFFRDSYIPAYHSKNLGFCEYDTFF